MFSEEVLEQTLNFQFLRENIYGENEGLHIPGSPFCKFLQQIMDASDKDGDEAKFDSFNAKLMKDINDDVKIHISNKTIILKDIPDYWAKLHEIDMAEDCPDEGIYIEGMPNINGLIISLMLTCAISKDSGLDKQLSSTILAMFQKPTISEIYDEYVQLFNTFIDKISGEQDKVKEAVLGLGDTLKKAAEAIDTRITIQNNRIAATEFVKIFLKKYDINNPGYSTSCCITLDDFVHGESIFTLPCGHSFSMKALPGVLSSSSSFNECPICRDDPLKNKTFWEGIDNIKTVLLDYENSDEMKLLNRCKEQATKTASKCLGE